MTLRHTLAKRGIPITAEEWMGYMGDWFVPEPNTGCWLWTRTTCRNGYGQLTVNWRYRSAHRVSYEVLVGAIPKGLQLDHLCNTKCCVNPDHLEPVTNLENSKRWYARVRHCKKGHEFTPENTGVSKRGWRFCRTCSRLFSKASQAKRRADKSLTRSLLLSRSW